MTWKKGEKKRHKLSELFKLILDEDYKEGKPLSSSVPSLLIKRSDSESMLIARWSVEPFLRVRT